MLHFHASGFLDSKGTPSLYWNVDFISKATQTQLQYAGVHHFIILGQTVGGSGILLIHRSETVSTLFIKTFVPVLCSLYAAPVPNAIY